MLLTRSRGTALEPSHVGFVEALGCLTPLGLSLLIWKMGTIVGVGVHYG